MKITKDYLRKVIKESLEEIKDEEGMDFGSGAPAKKKVVGIQVSGEGHSGSSEIVRSDVWSKKQGTHLFAVHAKLMHKNYKAGAEALFKSLGGGLKRSFEYIGTTNAWALYNLDTDKFVEGFMKNLTRHAGMGGRLGAEDQAILKLLSKNEDKLNALVEKAKSAVLKFHPEASKPPKRLKVVGMDPGRGGGGSAIYGQGKPLDVDDEGDLDEPKEDEDDLE